MISWQRLGPLRPLIRAGIPGAMIAALAWPGASRGQREIAAALLVGFWTVTYGRYRIGSKEASRQERELLRELFPEAFRSAPRAPSALDPVRVDASAYRRHRVRMRDALLDGTVAMYLRGGGVVLDIGGGAAGSIELVNEADGTYVGVDEPGDRGASEPERPAASNLRADAERLPFGDGTVDIVVVSGVIEHVLRPELAVWEIARVLRPDGVLVMTAPSASVAPLKSPLSHLFVWIEKALGAGRPAMISRRRWVRPAASGYRPHVQHIVAETRAMLDAGGLETLRWSTFEFPPPDSATARWISKRGSIGLRAAVAIEALMRRLPLLGRLGTHLLMVARKTREPIDRIPPIGIWPGPFSSEGMRGSVSSTRSTGAVAEV